MKKFKRKGFTIVELVIVVAIIAILAAVLIPTFSNIIKKAQMSADVQLARNLNTVLATASAEGRIPGSMYDVLYLENEAGYVIENLNPTAEGMYFAWDEAKNKILYITSDLESVYYPEDYTLNANDCWITVGSAEEAEVVAAKGYNLALECDIDEEIVLTNVVSINTLGFKCQNVTMTSGDSSVKTAYLIGTFGDTNITTTASNIVTSGVATSVNVSGNSATSVTVGGYVNSYSATGGAASVVSAAGLVNTVASNNTSKIESSGVVMKNQSTAIVTGGSNSTTENVVKASTKEDLESVRTQVASGLRNFKGETVELTQDINMAGIAFMPISNYSRDNRDNTTITDTWFQGTFDGNNYSITNFSNSGFSITGLNAGTNDSSVPFGESKVTYKEAVYALFGTAYNATFRDFNITCDIDMTLDNANQYVGDSVGCIVGFGYGSEIKFVNCTVSGTVKGYDGVAAFIGRCYAKQLVFTDCTNNADVTGVRKTAAFCGSRSGGTTTFANCVNNGTITCLGVDKDVELVAWNVDSNGVATSKITNDGTQNGKGYYCAAVACANPSSTPLVTISGLNNNGKVYVGGAEFKDANGNWYLQH